MFNRIQDLLVEIPDYGFSSRLSKHNIELIDLSISTPEIDVTSFNLPGVIGIPKGRLETNDSSVELTIQTRDITKRGAINSERFVRSIFSRPSRMTLTYLTGDKPMYEFIKIGDEQKNIVSMSSEYSIDVIPVGSISINRSGLTIRYVVKLQFDDIPYRYIKRNVVDLSKPNSKTDTSSTYSVYNGGSVTLDSKLFGINIELSGISTNKLNIKTTGDKFTPKGILSIDKILTTNDKIINDGYMTYHNKSKIADKTNYGRLYLSPGNNIIVLEYDKASTPTGKISFKEYIY